MNEPGATKGAGWVTTIVVVPVQPLTSETIISYVPAHTPVTVSFPLPAKGAPGGQPPIIHAYESAPVPPEAPLVDDPLHTPLHVS
mgnify:CR=1 FL=1